jgi:hypothetical protein
MKKTVLLGDASGAVLGLTGPFVQNAWAVSQPHVQAALHDLYAVNNEIQLAD